MLLLLSGIALVAVSGVPGLFLDRRSGVGQALATVLAVAGSAIGIGATLAGMAAAEPAVLRWPCSIPGGEFHVELDSLSGVFLLPIFLVSLCGSVYGLGYWKQADHPGNGRKLRLFYGLLIAGMALVVVARNALLFMTAWEIMA